MDPPTGNDLRCKLERLTPTLGVYYIGLIGLEFSVDERTIGTGLSYVQTCLISEFVTFNEDECFCLVQH